jgi:hypothetical protein
VTPFLRYNRVLNEISTDSIFRMTSPDGRVVEGIGFDSDPGLTAVNIHKNLRGSAGPVRIPDR